MKKLFFLIALGLALVSCDEMFDDENGYFEVYGEHYWLETAIQYAPPYEWTRESELIRVEFCDDWREYDEPGISLMLWVPGHDRGLVSGRYVFDPRTPEPFGIADGTAWGEDGDWISDVVDGWIDVDRWGHSCDVEFSLVMEGGRRLTGRYHGELETSRWD